MSDNTIENTDSGLIYAMEFDGNGSGREISWEEVKAPALADKLRWIHIDHSKEEVRDWLENQSGLDDTVIDELLETTTRPRCHQVGDGFMVLLRGVNLNEDAEAEDMVSVRLWFDKDRIISTRKRRVMSVQKIRDDLQSGRGPTGQADFLITLVNYLGNNIAGVIDELDDAIDAAESMIADNRPEDHYGDLGKFRRQTAHLRRYLAPQREALERLSRMQTELLTADDLSQLYAEANRMTLFVEELDLSRERAVAAREELLSNLAQDQNSKIYLLSLVAALFLPLSFITGLMGMNVAGLPGTENSSAFMILSALMVALAAGILTLFRWKRWI